ncbi:hypothetical protein QVD17_31232 [Tagetes erecta]|uniref:Uncharacterized protein n=1 Tax=Tagetes erecta TaxID=13708 RepID=A0AAD8K6N2_TARER|nr:hypothetical protein QVD17_31232 [Tagetes erecta]
MFFYSTSALSPAPSSLSPSFWFSFKVFPIFSHQPVLSSAVLLKLKVSPSRHEKAQSSSSQRGWFTFGHASFALLFFFGHIWHSARTLFIDVFAGIDLELDAQVEFGAFQKLGDSGM